MIRDGRDTVNEAGLRDLLNKGHLLQVLCVEEPDYRKNSWFGHWRVSVAAPDGTERRALAVDRPKEVRIREFKTETGLSSFLHRLGYRIHGIPFGFGEKVTLPRDWRKADAADIQAPSSEED